MSTLADKGVALVAEGKYAEGINKLSEALKTQAAPKWFIERSKAYLRTNEVELALHDAEQALSIAHKRANRDLMIDAQLRRATALFRLGRFADADICAFWTIRLVDGVRASEDGGQKEKVDENGDYAESLEEVEAANKATVDAKRSEGLSSAVSLGTGGRSKTTSNRNLAFTWRVNSLQAMNKLEPGAPGRKVSVVQYPTPSGTPPPKAKVTDEKSVMTDDKEPNEEADKPKIPEHILANVPGIGAKWNWEDVWNQFRSEHSKHRVRTDFYESDTTLNVSFFVKNVNKEELTVDAQEQTLTLSPIQSLPSRTISLRLHDKIKPEETTHTVKPMKVELVLKKAVPAKWRVLRDSTSSAFDHIAVGNASTGTLDEFVSRIKSLGHEDPKTFDIDAFPDTETWYLDLLQKLNSAGATEPPATTKAAAAASQPNTASHGSTTKENDNPASGMETQASAPAYPTSSKKGPKDWDSLEVEDEDEEDDEDSPDDFFQKLYKGADPDTRRAMMKSYVQSNGTSLSTSWEEAQHKEYCTHPPDSMEAKKWDE